MSLTRFKQPGLKDKLLAQETAAATLKPKADKKVGKLGDKKKGKKKGK